MDSFNTEIVINLGYDIKKYGIEPEIITKAIEQNQWFTHETILTSIEAIVECMLDEQKLAKWLSKYSYKNISNNRVGIIMAGNIPLVGFMDLLTVIVLGAKPYIKPSSKDSILMDWITKKLNRLGADIKQIDETSKIDIVIATGSNNANRYFEEKYPNTKKLLRHSRASVAIIDRKTTNQQIKHLWNDCFTYFGLGCRNISHLFISSQEDLNKIHNLWQHNKISHSDYIASYKQQKAILTMKNEQFTDCGYVLLHKSNQLFPMIGTISYSIYNSVEQLLDIINQNRNNIQCIVGNGNIEFGQAQYPQLWDYADNIDTIEFLYDK